MLRSAFALAATTLLLALPLPAALRSPGPEPTGAVRHVYVNFAERAEFDSLAEPFTGREHHGRDIVLRTDPAVRAGLYFLVRVQDREAQAAARFRLEVVKPEAREPTVFEFERPAGVEARPVTRLGLTGAAYPDRDRRPLAWRVTVLDPDGREIGSARSFLWSVD